MSRVLWLSDAGCVSGFGRVTHSIAERLVAQYGHEIHVLAVNYRGDPFPTDLQLYVPTRDDPADTYGLQRIVPLLRDVDPDVVVMLNDPNIILTQLFLNPYDPRRILLQLAPIIAYMPVDGTQQPPIWGERLSAVTNPVVMSRHGRSIFPRAPLVYHGVDTDRFHPATAATPHVFSDGSVARSKSDCKRELGYDPDGFLVLRVDKNRARKDFAASWKALLPVMRRHTDIQVHFHTNEQVGDNGVVLEAMFSREPDMKDRFFLPKQVGHLGWKEQDLAGLYAAADLFISTSHGEGFGLTLAEAAASGVPVIAQNVSSIPEVVGPGSILLEPTGTVTVPSGQEQWLPDIGAFSEAIEHLYNAGGVRRKLGKAGRDHVSKLTWDFAAARFDEFIRALSGRTGTSEGTSAVRVEQRPASGGA
jgi:glycosyltransferase involved in cell wall biosynthesis